MREELVRELAGIVGAEHVLTGPAELVAYSYDGTFQQAVPDVVVSPSTTEEVAAVVRAAAGAGLPVITRGAGTSLAGGTIPVGGGLVLNLARMNRILEIDRENSVAAVQAGVVTADLQRAVEAEGLFYPPDPASLQQSTIGGNVACNAGGPRCLKYGVTRDYVLGLTVVLADGRVLRLGGKVLKSATGYPLTQLFVGSEGTLGVVTEAVLRLRPLPRARSTAAAYFAEIDQASRAVTAVFAAGVLPAALELLDRTAMRVVEEHLGLGLPPEAEAMLVLEQDGHDEAAVRAEAAAMAEACRAAGAFQVRTAATPAERDELWRARRAVSGALGRAAPNKLGEDVVVPRGRIPEMVRAVREIERESGLAIAVFGHAGDGNLHPNILFDLRREGELARVERAAAAIFEAALSLGGTLSGEHGIGTLKREFLETALGPEVVAVMRALKAVLDPQGLLNPHKVFPEADRSAFLRSLPTLEGRTPG
ncbi:MAG TPA: FAD-linked oxidase C-terminal domain-containing protein [Dehalococcoidia bacterium]